MLTREPHVHPHLVHPTKLAHLHVSMESICYYNFPVYVLIELGNPVDIQGTAGLIFKKSHESFPLRFALILGTKNKEAEMLFWGGSLIRHCITYHSVSFKIIGRRCIQTIHYQQVYPKQNIRTALSGLCAQDTDVFADDLCCNLSQRPPGVD